MEVERDMTINQLSIIERALLKGINPFSSYRSCGSNKTTFLSESYESNKAALLSIAASCGSTCALAAGVPVLAAPIFLYGFYQAAQSLRLANEALMQAAEQNECCVCYEGPDDGIRIINEALKQAAKQSKCCICYEGPDDGIRIIMDIPCINIHPDHICVECYQGILQKNAKCPQCRGVLRNVLEI